VTARYVAEPSGNGSELPGTERLGVFGSSFNPPHLAHLVFLGEARWRLGLSRVIVVPTGDAYHKEPESDPGSEARLRMTEAAFSKVEGVEVDRTEVRKPGPSYTCDTLEVIAGRNETSEIHLLMGADAALGFAGWHRPERILELARIGIAPRPGTGRAEVETVFAGMDADDRVDFIEMPEVDISSTLIRRRLDAGEPFRHLVPTAVAQMIENEDTYGND
jgi:nicotinate-nucleotide adenylyltransferase